MPILAPLIVLFLTQSADPLLRVECTGPLKSLSTRERYYLAKTVNIRFVNAAATQLSGQDNVGGDYPEYLQALIGWLREAASFARTNQVTQEFKAGHRERLELYYRLAKDPSTKFPTEAIFIKPVGSINKTSITSPRELWQPDPVHFSSQKQLEEAIDKLQTELARVRDEREVRFNLNQGLLRWKIRKVLELVNAGEKKAAQERLDRRLAEAKAEQKTLTSKDFLEVEGGLTNGKLLEAALFIIEDPSLAPLPWVDQMIETVMSSFIQKVQNANETVLKLKEGWTGVIKVSMGVKTVWTKVRAPVEAATIIMLVYATLTTNWTKLAQNTEWAFHRWTTPTQVLAWEDHTKAMADLKIVVADPASRFDEFGPNLGNNYQIHRSDHTGRVAHEFLTYWRQTGRTDWTPTNPADKGRVPAAMDMIQTYNILMFGTDNSGNKIVTGAIERLPIRENNLDGWNKITTAIENGEITKPLPLADGTTPPGPSKPTVTSWSKVGVAWSKTKDFTIGCIDKSWKWTKSWFANEEPKK